MKEFKEIYNCNYCGNNFEWKYIKLENEQAVFTRMENMAQNIINFSETQNHYIFQIRCPYCNKKHIIEEEK